MAVIRKRKPRSDGGDSRYVVDYRDASGRRRWETFTTYGAAEARLGEVLRETRQAAPPVVDPNITVGEWAEQWLTQIMGHVRPRTLRGYRDILNRYILPTHKTWKLRQIHRGHLRRHLDAHAAKGYGKNTLRLIRATWSVLLADAVEDGLLAMNPVTQLGRRRRRREVLSKTDRTRSIRPLSHEELAKFLRMAHARLPRRDYVLMLLYADTGVRPGEAPPLQWADFDPVARTLTVERAVSDGVVGATKTDEPRVIDLTPRLVNALNTLQAQQESEALLAGDDPSPLIFPSTANTPPDPSAISKTFRSVLRAAGVPRHRLYDLRHTFASQLLADNAPPLYVAAQMGDRVETVFRHYAQWVPRGDSHWAVRLAASREAAAARLSEAGSHLVATKSDDAM